MAHFFVQEDELSFWLISIGALFFFIGGLIACICSCRRNHKSELLGLPGMVTITSQDGEGYNGLSSPNSSLIISRDIADGGKRASTANRSLPDIPKDKSTESGNASESMTQDVIYEAAEVLGYPSVLYATVRDKGEDRSLDIDKSSISQQSSQYDTVNPYASLTTQRLNGDEHPYAQVQNVQKTEPNSRNSGQTMDNAEPSTSTSQMTNPVAPPRTRRSSSHNSLLSQEPLPDIQAANAIAGGVQANQDLPYMTPPILMPLPHPPQAPHNNPQQHFSGDSQDSKGYTSISVREPLANIIAQTKEAHLQRQNMRSLTDWHYATVSDDSDEMYAAIDERDKVYTSGSETYAQIQPMASEASRVTQNEQPATGQAPRTEEQVSAPQPPSVDSLRHVAHAHSRQASSSSATSSIVNPSSPKPEKRQANSPLPPPPEISTDVYSSIEKRLRSSISSGKSLEDMYAKVIKKKKDNEDFHEASYSNSNVFNFDVPLQKRKLSLVEPNRASWSSHESGEAMQKREPEVSHCHVESGAAVVVADTEFSRVTDECRYEALATTSRRVSVVQRVSDDPNYETLTRNGIDSTVLYSVPFKRRQSKVSNDDPGYEKVGSQKRADPESEPNYESMPHDSGEPNYASVSRAGDSDTDPNYESVSHDDPNYESVKYMSLSTREEPPYEQLSNLKLGGYEKVGKRSSQQKDPDYEKIDPNYSTLRETVVNADTDDEQYVQV